MRLARVLTFSKGGRQERVALVKAGKAPRDFFYGTDRLVKQGYDIVPLASDIGDDVGGLSRLTQFKERILNRVTCLGLRTSAMRYFRADFSQAKVALSFTDGFSITMGHHFRDIPKWHSPFLIGCFHGLCDLEQRAQPCGDRGSLELSKQASIV